MIPAALRGLALAVVVSSAPAPAAAAALVLGEPERQAALSVGAAGVADDSFGVEWRVENAAGESVTVMTPFHRLALAARQAAFKGEALTPAEQQRLLRAQRNRLVLWVRLRGDREDFARFFRPTLRVDGRSREPAFVQNERTALPLGDGAYLARCVYAFPTDGLAGEAATVLVVRDRDGREVSRFTIDLGRMR